jgi:hypothetical protein
MIEPLFDTIPNELKERQQWVFWREIERDGKATKIPVDTFRRNASSTDPDTWSDFETVAIHYNPETDAGVGYVFSSEDELLGVDLDGCRDPETGQLSSWAEEIIEEFHTYTEVSPSGTGVKMFCRSDRQLPKGKKKDLDVPAVTDKKTPGIEVYSQGRYFAVTGNKINGYEKVTDCTRQVDCLLEEHWPYTPTKAAETHDWHSDDAVVERARRYVAKMPAAVSGASGHNQTFSVACRLVKGFGLSKPQAMDVLREYNQRCEPPWSEHELQHKVDDAEKQPGEVGYMRNASPDRYDQITIHHPTAQPKKELEPDKFAGLPADELEDYSTQEPEWLVEGIFSADQPTLFGARSKCLKTTQLVDLGVSLATATSWLGAFEVAKPRRVLFITGESNYRAASRRINKACKARGTTMGEVAGMLRVEARNFPKLPREEDCLAVQEIVRKYEIDVVILDPLYRGLTNDIDTNRMQMVGDAIVSFAQHCQPASLIISHHVVKVAARDYGNPPELEDMTGAGIAESCGNWWLVGRNEKYAWDWTHDLCVQFGGRDEQAGARRIVFNEQEWTADVENLHDFITGRQEAAEKAKDDAKRERHHRKIQQARTVILKALRNIKTPQSKNSLENRRGPISQAAFREALADMIQDHTVMVYPYKDVRGRMQSEGHLLAEYGREYEAELNS